METKNLLSKKSLRESYEAYSGYFEKIIQNVIKILQNKGEVTEYTTDYRRFRTERDNEHRQYKQCNDKVVEHLYIVKVSSCD
jgi:adenine-specific DNA-methyltransferase